LERKRSGEAKEVSDKMEQSTQNGYVTKNTKKADCMRKYPTVQTNIAGCGKFMFLEATVYLNTWAREWYI
jgi:hypothetical protein